MFVEHKEAMEVTEAPAKVTKLSGAIRIGAGLCDPIHGAIFFYRGKCCAVATALVAYHGSYEVASRRRHDHSHSDGVIGNVSRIFSVPYDTVLEVSHKFERKEATREQCADWLESQGY